MMFRAVALAGLVAVSGCYEPPIVRPERTESYDRPKQWIHKGPPRPDRIEEIETVQGFTVALTPSGVSGWNVRIQNDSDEPAKLDWDESSFVSLGGISLGRLISGKTRQIDYGKPQLPELMPAHALVIEQIFPEKLVAIEFDEQRLVKYQREHGHIEDSMRRIMNREYAVARKAETGGTIRLMIDTSDGDKAWVAKVVVSQEAK